ncbi:alpha/beta hydrolase [Nocardia transvalensis]|uniref:alpha/beta hydrolase n=1 Tax=Nocardia transvalensis TaxID=37333 RepID=UPI00189599DF|nr:alpha/beta hydrolase [Nocardia transvalensis]MBF6332806.1 alpha/beta hydrolase [Nocardia transvalensis]
MAEPRVLDALADHYSFMTPDASLEELRVRFEQSMARVDLPAGVTREEGEVAGVPGAWFRLGHRTGKTIVFLHGSGFIAGSSRSHGVLAAYLARASAAEAFVLDYRLAPEHPFPAAVDDGLTVLEAIVTERGAHNVVIAGESAGAGLVLATLLAARQNEVAMPAAAITMSVWADLTQSGDSILSRADVDPFVTKEQLDASASAYLAGADATNPLASPALADLHGLPHVYMQVGTEEILYDDTMRVREKIRAAGGKVTVDVQDGMPHAHQLLVGRLPEAETAIEQAGAFVRSLP